MRRRPLDPPQSLHTLARAKEPPASGWPVDDAGRGDHSAGPPTRSRLDPGGEAVERHRRLFHPRRGWLRRLERGLSQWLSATVYPRVPFIHHPYGRQLRRDLCLADAEIALPDLPSAFADLRVLLITDLHAGPFVLPGVLAETLRRLVAVGPDLVLLAGDLTTSRVSEIDTHAEAFGELRAPLGVFAVLGNHDHATGDARAVIRGLASCGIEVLHNRSVVLERAGQRLTLAGVDDRLMGQPDLDAALEGATPPVILLSHNPDLLFEAARRGVALVLSGHTHGGQIRVPGWPVLFRQSRYRLDEGRFRASRTELVVSRGLGAVGLPWRLACPPEAVLLRLARHPGGGRVPAPGAESRKTRA